jgi:SRSO17 transposase
MMMIDLVAAELDRVHERIAGRFGRAEPRARVREYVSGLVAGLERKNGWTLAERAGEVSPDGMQRLLRRADWDVDGVRDDIRDYVVEELGDRDGVLIADDTGFLKKGTRWRVCSGSTPGRRGGRRTARWARSWRMPRCTGTR